MNKTNPNQTISGLTIREYFAAMAMQGLLTTLPNTEEEVAKISVQMADTLIKELNK